MRLCYNCGARLPERERVPFKELCPKCDAFLHCCRNCRLYDPHAHNHCRSHTTEFVSDVERGNFCEEFAFLEIESSNKKPEKHHSSPPRRQNRGGGGGGSAASQNENLSARERFENLFKD